MPTFLTEIPSLCFPHELDTLRIRSSGDLKLNIYSGSVEFQATLTPVAGIVSVFGLAPMMRDFVSNGPKTVSIEATDSSHVTIVQEPTVLPCNVRTSMPAKKFVVSSFLCTSDPYAYKPTYEGCTELLTAYTSQDQETPQWNVEAIWIYDGSIVRTSYGAEVIEDFGVSDGNIYYGCGPDRILAASPKDGARLVSYDVRLGRRLRRYRLMTRSEHAAPLTVKYLNAFRTYDTLHFPGGAELDEKVQHYTATINSLTRDYRTQRTPELTLRTQLANPYETDLLAQCAASTRLWLLQPDGSQEEVRCTDSSLKLPASAAELTAASITIRYVSDTPPLSVNQLERTFDESFGTEFY